MTRFIIIVCAAFFARVKPVSTSAKPACMNSTSTPPTISHARLMARWSWAITADCAVSVAFCVFPGTTIVVISVFEVPVVEPFGSPLSAPAIPTSPTTSMSTDSTMVTSRRLRNFGVSCAGTEAGPTPLAPEQHRQQQRRRERGDDQWTQHSTPKNFRQPGQEPVTQRCVGRHRKNGVFRPTDTSCERRVTRP